MIILGPIAQAQDDHSKVGLLQSLQQIVTENKQELFQIKQDTVSQNTRSLDINDIRNFKIAPAQMLSILLFTPSKYLLWAKDDPCRFLALIENNLLKDSQGPIKNLLIKVKTESNKNAPTSEEIIKINTKRFTQLSYSYRCVKNRNIRLLFTPKHIKNTLKRLNLNQPKDIITCKKQFKELINKDSLPYLCGVLEKTKELDYLLYMRRKLKQADKIIPFSLSNRINIITQLSSRVSKYQQSYIKVLCTNMNNEKYFCQSLLHNDLWANIKSGVKPEYFITYFCRSLYRNHKKQQNSTELIQDCITMLRNNPRMCLTANYRSAPSSLPHPNCQNLALNLEHSRLYTNHQDCPGLISNTYITNTSRIIKHFLAPPPDHLSCTDSAYSAVATMLHKFDKKKTFETKICFNNPIRKKEECLSYLPETSEQLPNSESVVLSKVLMKVKRLATHVKCRLVNYYKFNPQLLKYRNGCVVTYKNRNCTATGCPKQIYYNATPVKGIYYKGTFKIQYRPSRFNKTQYAINKQLKKVYKIKEKIIHNLTEAKFFLDLNKKYIIHGVGCAEDIYPQKFPRTALNQCKILPFIIDGYRKERNQTLLITRTAIDDIHSPRALHWIKIYSSVKSFQNLHPLNAWTLYGLRESRL